MRPPHRLEWDKNIAADFRALAAVDRRLVEIARTVAFDVANHHAHGKALGQRHISGDLTGFYRMSFDLPGYRPHRFRLVYDRPSSGVVRIVAIGGRESSAVYRALADRLETNETLRRPRDTAS